MSFLGLVRYVASFLPKLADLTRILTPLTKKDTKFCWTEEHSTAFNAIKNLVASRECLTVIDHENPGDNKIFLTTDASDYCSGALLSYGPTWETARPVAFDSMTFKGAELNYPVHEKELLAIIRACRKWRSDLLGSHFTVFTDHRTLENFLQQKDLSRRQARWMEFLSQFELTIKYIKGSDNSAADALSRVHLSDSSQYASELTIFTPSDSPDEEGICVIIPDDKGPWTSCVSLAATCLPEKLTATPICPVLSLAPDATLLKKIRKGYKLDPWCKKLISAATGMNGLVKKNDLWFLGERLLIPRANDVRELLFYMAHDALGHFGFDKSYESLRNDYYWPNMRRDLENAYIKSCPDCQRKKSSTTSKPGPLHPLPVPDGRFKDVAIDFIGPLTKDGGYDYLVTMTDRLGADVQLAAAKSTMTAQQFACIFFDKWYCENGLPDNIVSDRDKLFLS
jgi:hypothetical protein